MRVYVLGNRESHVGEPQAKSILVNAGGTLEIHGQPKLSWTKLDGTLIPSREKDIVFEHMVSQGCVRICVFCSYCYL